MNFIVTSNQMKTAEQNAVNRGLPLRKLAENAASVCYSYIVQKTGNPREKTFAFLCGSGMNGGDGMLLAGMIKEAGGEVLCIFVSGIPVSGIAKEIYQRCSLLLPTTLYKGNELAVQTALTNCHMIIDCVFGTGFRGNLDSDTAELFKFINEDCRTSKTSGVSKMSIDIPSGIDSDTGKRADFAFIPDTTLILGAYKKGILSHFRQRGKAAFARASCRFRKVLCRKESE